MLRPFPFGSHRLVRGLTGALCAALLACAGGDGPDEPTGPGPAPEPGPPQPTDNVVAGTYVLVRINESAPGGMVTLANPDGSVIGLFRFHGSSTLALTEQQTWSLVLHFADDAEARVIEDRGRFKRTGEDLSVLSFRSEVYGDVFLGRAVDGVAAITYDIDGDGEAETVFGFQRVE